MSDILSLDIQSEIGELEGVILHTPGAEVENMTPRTAQRALYSDILNLSIAQREYEQLQGILVGENSGEFFTTQNSCCKSV